MCLPHSDRSKENGVHSGKNKGHSSCQKGGAKLSCHRRGGQLPHLPPSPTNTSPALFVKKAGTESKVFAGKTFLTFSRAHGEKQKSESRVSYLA